MMGEMVERVEKAVEIYLIRAAFHDTPVQRREMCLAAIRAMREPTEAMIKAGQKAAVVALHRDGGYRMQDTWQAMIDAALSPEQEQG